MVSLRDQLQDLNRSGLIILREAEDEFNPVTVDCILNRDPSLCPVGMTEEAHSL